MNYPKDGDGVFPCISHSPSPWFFPRLLPSLLFLSLTSLPHPILTPSHNPVCPLRFYSGSTMGRPLVQKEACWGGKVGALDVTLAARVVLNRGCIPQKLQTLPPWHLFRLFISVTPE